MTGIVAFETRSGLVAVEVEESVALAAGGTVEHPDIVTKGGMGADVFVRSAKSFSEAMSTLRACAEGLDDLISKLDLTPSEVDVEFSLKMSGSAGFVIAKAGAESELKVALKWEPKGGRAS